MAGGSPTRAPQTPARTAESVRIEAEQVVPNVSALGPPPPPVAEASESGHVPARELDRVMSDMLVLLRYGHAGQVRGILERLFRRYPEDLLLLRRVAEFHLESGDVEGAMNALFTLARRLFERRNIVGMQQALEQVLVLDPQNPRAERLLVLLNERRTG